MLIRPDGAVLLFALEDGALALPGGGVEAGETHEEALARAFLAQMPTKKFIQPEEVGALCAYLCSDAARSITGAPISIDGGWFAN